jgi:DNA-directed RNA polymerase specialized sigma24 family protein
MNEEDWLAANWEGCVASLIAVLHRRGLSAKQAADLACDAVSFAGQRLLEVRPVVESERHRRNWVLRVALNYAIDVRRTETRRRWALRRQFAEGGGEAALAPEPSPLQPFLDLMRGALARLPEEEQRLIEARFGEGASLQELVDEFGLGSVPTAHRRIRAILQRLRAIMEVGGAVPDGWQSEPAWAPPEQ